MFRTGTPFETESEGLRETNQDMNTSNGLHILDLLPFEGAQSERLEDVHG